MSNNNEINTLINQAKSEARSESIKKFFSKNSKVFIAIAAVVLVSFISFAAFNFYQNSQQAKFSEIFHQALIDQQLGNMDKAKENLAKIYQSSAPSGVKSLASLRYAAILINENKKSEAADIYQKISQCSGCDSYIKDLGGLLAVKTWLSDENEIKKDHLLTRIEKIEANSKELRYQISEQKAFLHIRKNDLSKAYAILDSISKNPDVPQNIKARISDGLKIIIAKGYDPSAEVVQSSEDVAEK